MSELKLIKVEKSSRPGKRLMAIFERNGRKLIRHFGYRNKNTGKTGSTYIDHKNPITKKNWIARHQVRGKFNDPLTASSLSRWILWNKKTLAGSIKDFKKRFNL